MKFFKISNGIIVEAKEKDIHKYINNDGLINIESLKDITRDDMVKMLLKLADTRMKFCDDYAEEIESRNHKSTDTLFLLQELYTESYTYSKIKNLVSLVNSENV